MPNIYALLFSCISFLFHSPEDFITPYEKSGNIHSATYAEIIDYYEQLDKAFPEIKMIEYGKTDVGKPLHLVVVSKDKVFDPVEIRQSGKRILLVNNGIHAGEPCGIDASMMLARDLVQNRKLRKLLDHQVIAFIPAYNIGGVLNRGCCSRANQNGPEAYGFRGNARNYDLNRDFIKADTRNARSFHEIFQTWQPEVFIDNHTTNGADYPAVLTYIATQPDKAHPKIGAYMQEKMLPDLKAYMDSKNILICPYVNSIKNTPDDGISYFLDLPRYSSGYASLFHTMSFISEAHMLKEFHERVNATYEFMQGLIGHIDENYQEIGKIVMAAREQAKTREEFDIAWQLDQENHDNLLFEGYEAKYKPSEITGQNRLYYDRNSPWKKEIPFYNRYMTTQKVKKPFAYIIPQGQERVIQNLETNQIEIFTFQRDTTLSVEVSYISDILTSTRSYEGHYYHTEVKLRKDKQTLPFYAGDKVVYVNQTRNPYIIHTLEPEAQDAFFRWNYFDAILMRKEYFSPYVFEDEAARILEKNPELRERLEERKGQDSTFIKAPWMQLNFIYENSPYYEKTHNRYPIVRLNEEVSLPVN